MKLVNTLLDFSRIEAGRIEAVYQATDLAALTTDLASIFRSAIERAGLSLRVECPPLPEPAYVDRDMWEKIVLNLLSNAFKFTLQGEISVELRAAGQQIELSVRDTGTGIPAEELPRLFERFHRVQNAQARTNEGSGIGLALVQELVKLHGGSIRVESVPGAGTVFTVSIPLGNAHLPADRIQAPRTQVSTALGAEPYIGEALRWLPAEDFPVASADLSAGVEFQSASSRITPRDAAGALPASRILLADDNADMREYVQRLLGEHYEVVTVADGQAALENARERAPDLILTDVMMPRLDGFGLLQAIRNDPALKNTPVILLSARAGEESRIEGLESGANDYLVKPFSARELLARVASHLTMARIRREAAELEQKLRAEAELERARLRELFMQAPAGIGLLSGPELRWSFVNKEYIRFTGRTCVEDFLGKTIRESLPESQGQGFFELLDQVYRTGVPYIGIETKATLKRTDGGQAQDAYFNFVYQPLRNVEHCVEGILVHAVEVTEQVLARKKLEKSEERFRAIVDTTPDCVKIVAADGSLLHMNSSGLAMIGADCAEAVAGKERLRSHRSRGSGQISRF